MSAPITKELAGVFVTTEGWDDLDAAFRGINWIGGSVNMDMFADIAGLTVPKGFIDKVTISDVVIIPKWRLEVAESLASAALSAHLGTEGYMTRQFFALDRDYKDRQDTDLRQVGIDPRTKA